MKCFKCKANLFKIEIRKSCVTCPYNGKWSEEKQAFEHNGEAGDQAQADGECDFGTNHCNG